MARTHPLSRSDVRQRKDVPTNSIILEYIGRRLRFDEYLYGFPEGTFFYIELADVPYPEPIERLREEIGIDVDALPDALPLRRAIADAIAAGAMVDAPEHLADLGTPEVEWLAWDRRELERKHRIAETRVKELARVLEADLKIRAGGFKKSSFEMVSVEALLEPSPPPPPLAVVRAAPEPPPPVAAPPAPSVPAEVEVVEEEIEDEDEETLTPASVTVRKACAAVNAAREAELPQRFPAGVRRRLRRMPPGAFIAYGEVIDIREDLCAAMTDGRAMARKNRETVVIHYDGEWPVVVRRYGQGGRTVYKIESALRRQGIEVQKVEVV